MSKRPTDDLEPAAKKRGNSRQLTKDDHSDDEEEERGIPETASEDVLKTRKILKARRGSGAPPSTPTAGAPKAIAAANPFAGISILGPPAAAAQPATTPSTAAQILPAEIPGATASTASAAEAKGQEGGAAPPLAESNGESPAPMRIADGEREAPKASGTAPSTFAALAANSAPFAAVTTSNTFGFGSLANGSDKASTSGLTAGSDDKEAAKSGPFGFGASSTAFSFQPKEGGFPAVTTIFGSNSQIGNQDAAESDSIKPALAVLPPELETVTGEEDEQNLWAGEGTLYEFDQTWKERGKGELRINRGQGRAARFVMRQKGHHRLLMNANLWAEMKATPMDGGKGARFPVINAVKASEEAGDPKLQTFAFRLKAASQLQAFMQAVEENKAPQK